MVCTEGKGCQAAVVQLSPQEIDRLLGKPNFLAASSGALLVLNDCKSELAEANATAIHAEYGGTGIPKALPNFDLQAYLRSKGCLACPNTVKKISFTGKGEGVGGSSYFYINIRGAEAYMPNDAWQQLNAGGEGGDVLVDAFIRNDKMTQYIVDPEGGKHEMHLTTNSFGSTEIIASFNRQFKPTGRTRKFFAGAGNEQEYKGYVDGKETTVWLGPAYGVCLPPQLAATPAFWNLGYISVGGKTALVTQISGPDFDLKITSIGEGNYTFNPAGYKPLGTALSQSHNGSAAGAEAIAELQKQVAEEKNAEVKALLQQQLAMLQKIATDTEKSVSNFEESSNITGIGKDLKEMMASFSTFEAQLNVLKTGKARLAEEIAELTKEKTEYSKTQIANRRCLLACNEKEQAFLLQLLTEEKTIKSRYKQDQEKRDEALGKLNEKYLQRISAGNTCACK